MDADDPNAQQNVEIDGAQRAANNNDGIRTVQLKLPPFWKARPQLWFLQIEAQFQTNAIRADLSKYNHLVGKLDTDILDKVSDLVLSPPTDNKYIALKDRLIKEFSETERKKLKTLFAENSTEVSKPTELLRKMRDNTCGKVSDDLLKELWFNRLPQNIQSILSCSSEPLEQLSAMADKIYETMNSDSIQAFSSQHHQGDSDLAKQICNLEDKVESLQKEINKSKSRNRSPWRNRDNQRSSRQDVNQPTGLCRYHLAYRENAYKCVPPCSYIPPKKNTNDNYNNTSYRNNNYSNNNYRKRNPKN